MPGQCRGGRRHSNRPVATRHWIVAVALGSVAAAGFFVLAPHWTRQHWDSLGYGFAVETRGLGAIWGNHPLGHILLNLSYLLVEQVGYQGRALTTFQFMNAVTSGVTVATLYLISTTLLGNGLLSSAGLAVILAGSYTFWHYTGTGDIYALSTLFLLLAWAALIVDIFVRQRAGLWRAGFATGLAVLAHQANSFMVPAGLLSIVLSVTSVAPASHLSAAEPDNQSSQGSRLRLLAQRAGSFLLAAGATAVAGYALAGLLATGSSQPAVILAWMRGYFGAAEYGSYFQLGLIPLAGSSLLSALVPSTAGRLASLLRVLVLLALLIPLVWGMMRCPRNSQLGRTLTLVSLAYLVSYGLAVLWWEPTSRVDGHKFWMLALVPFLLLLGSCWRVFHESIEKIGSRRLGRAVAHGYLPLTGLILIFVNFSTPSGIVQEHRPNELRLRNLQQWTEHSRPDDVLLMPENYVPWLRYWLDRPNALRLDEAMLGRRNDRDRREQPGPMLDQALASGRTVLAAERLAEYWSSDDPSLIGVTRSDAERFLDQYRPGEHVFEYTTEIDGSTMRVFRLAE